MSEYAVENDGVDHINVSIFGSTNLGRMLAPEAFAPFYHPKHGQFLSVAGMRGWAVTGRRHEIFRWIHGDQAMSHVVSYAVVHDEQMPLILAEGIEYRLQQHGHVMWEFSHNTLPYVSYSPSQPTFKSELEAWAYGTEPLLEVLRRLQSKYVNK